MNACDESDLAFIDGAAIDIDDYRIYIGCAFADLDVNASCMLLMVGQTTWMSHDITTKVVSVDACRSPTEFYALGRDGFVSIATPTDTFREQIPGAGTGRDRLGYVKRIRRIGESLYVCGHRHQVYRRQDGAWYHMDDEIIVTQARAVGYNLNAINGTTSDNIYAVGDRGLIFHYDGKHWKQMDSPTNVSLEDICITSDHIYICGAQGILMCGSGKKWDIITPDFDFRETLWSIARFRDEIYLSTPLRLMKWDGNELSEIDPGVEIVGSLNRLTASERTLWAVGVNSLLCFDGANWEKVVYPGNR